MPSLYEQDFYEWSMETASLVRQGRFADIDIDNLAEEIESMGRSVKRALKRRLEILLVHLLKWEYQDAFRSKSWRYTIFEQRRAIHELLDENPSLKALVNEILEPAYKNAVKEAAEETELKPSTFPHDCRWSFEQVLDDDFWPEGV